MEARRRGENPDTGWSMLLPVLVLAVIGARLYHVIHMWGFYSQDPWLIPQIWKGGLGIPGAVAGGVLAIWLYSRWAKLNTLRWFDIFASAMLLGQAIGRLGNFVNQELYGPPTTLPWGIPIDAAHRVGPWTDLAAYPVDTTRFHPLFAYEALLNLVGLVAHPVGRAPVRRLALRRGRAGDVPGLVQRRAHLAGDVPRGELDDPGRPDRHLGGDLHHPHRGRDLRPAPPARLGDARCLDPREGREREPRPEGGEADDPEPSAGGEPWLTRLASGPM